MSQTTVFLPAAACAASDDQLEVVRVQDGRVERLPYAAALAGLVQPWRLVLPVEAVTACAVQLPTQKARWLRQALPFAVEELLAEDVDQLHLALGATLADGRQRVFAVRREWLAGWLQLAGDNPPARIAVDADLQPLVGSQLLWLDGRWLLGGEPVARLALGEQTCSALLAGLPAPLQVRSLDARLPADCNGEALALDDVHAWLAQQEGSCDLAQAEFAARSAQGDARHWRLLPAVAGLCLLLQWGFFLAQGWYLQREGDAYRQSSEALYRELFPEDSRLIDLRAQFDQHLAAGTPAGQGRLLTLLGQASDALLAEDGQVRVQQLDFSDSRGDLALQVQAPGFEVLERLRERLVQAGLAVELGSASREAGGVSARVVIGS